MTTQNYAATIHTQQFIVNRTKNRAYSFMIYQQNTAILTAASLSRPCEHVQQTKSRARGYQVMLKSLISDTVTDLVECVRKNFARICKDINTPWPYMASP
jgi:hypothetical protein